MKGRQRRTLICFLAGAILIGLAGLAFLRSIGSPAILYLQIVYYQTSFFLLLLAGLLLLGVGIVELFTQRLVQGKYMLISTLAVILVLLFAVSSYIASIDESVLYSWTPATLVAVISVGYLLIAGWAFLANAIDKPFTRSQALMGGSLANILIGFVILFELNIQRVLVFDQLLLIIVLAIISSSLAWSSVLEVEEADKSSTKWVRAWRVTQALFFTFIGPSLMLYWMTSTIGFSA